jgi:hypothetical protein
MVGGLGGRGAIFGPSFFAGPTLCPMDAGPSKLPTRRKIRSAAWLRQLKIAAAYEPSAA